MNAIPELKNFQPELFRQLSNCFLLPDENTSGYICSLEYLVTRLYPGMANEAENMINVLALEDATEQLKIDYTRLFIGPYAMLAPPYESVYLSEGYKIMGECTMQVVEIYRKAGFELSEEYNDAPDHIATELEFVYILMSKIEEGNLSGDATVSARYQGLLYELIMNHLSHWIDELTDRILKHAENSFYRSLANITWVVVQAEIERLTAS